MVDTLDVIEPEPVVEKSATAWLIRSALDALNTPGERAESAYKYAAECLRERRDASNVLSGLFRSTTEEDVGLRWGALFVTGDVGDASSAEFLVDAALAELPEHREEQGCEGPRDGELLIRTMAVEALQALVTRHEEARKSILRVVAARPARPLLVEAVKAACALGLADEASELLPKDQRWMLKLEIRAAKQVMAEPEREDTGPLGFMPPKSQSKPTSPMAECCSPRREG